MREYLEMLRHMRPDGSKTHLDFCDRYLLPMFGKPDSAGNYYRELGKDSRIMFAAHSDTVHASGGFQKIQTAGDMVTLHPCSKSNCLGADCTTGLWLILEMMRAKIPGKYAIFAGEEIGCIGSRFFVENRKADFRGVDFVLSFDRKGTESIITHQSNGRTCSDNFAADLGRALGLGMRADDTGSYTDSNEFAFDVSECTNVSVGYYSQHTAKESQDLAFLSRLRIALLECDWSSLKAYRDPSAIDFRADKFKRSWRDMWADYYDSPKLTLQEICRDYPDYVADWMESNGLDADTLADEIGLNSKERKWGLY